MGAVSDWKLTWTGKVTAGGLATSGRAVAAALAADTLPEASRARTWYAYRVPLVRPVSVYVEALTGLALTFVYGPSGLARPVHVVGGQVGLAVVGPVEADRGRGRGRGRRARSGRPGRSGRSSAGTRRSGRRGIAGVAVRLRCVAKMPAKVLGVPPVSSGDTGEEARRARRSAPTETGAPPSIW